MRWMAVVVFVVGCGATKREPLEVQLRDEQFSEYVDAFIAATSSHDPAAIRRFLHDEVVVGGLWFEDVECLQQFPVPSVVKGPRLDALARCLASLNATRSDRDDPLPDTAVLQYPPGIEIEARLFSTPDGPWLSWIGYVARRDMRDAIPTITTSVLENARVAGTPNPPIEGPAAAHDISLGGNAYAWTKVCLDSSGAVSSASVREASSPGAARLFTAAMKDWQFKPIALRGQASPVCSMVFTVSPGDKGPKRARLPFPLPEDPQPLTMVPHEALGPLVAGTKGIAPDDDAKVLIHRAKIKYVVGAFEYCVGLDGHVYRVATLRSTGLPSYDKRIHEKMREWQFNPFLDGDQPTRVCSSAVFVYTQD